MKALRAAPAIATLCRVLEVSPSGYYAWHRRPASPRAREDAALTAEIEAIHIHSRGTYGAPRIHAELVARGRRVSRKRVARLMRAAQLRSVSRRKFVVTTTRAADARPAPDLVRRAFTETGPNQLWVADITYIPTGRGFLYLAVVLDVWSRRIVGWAMETHLRTALVLAALVMAVEQRQPRAVIHHSDQGCQYTALTFGGAVPTGGRPPVDGVGRRLLRQRTLRELLCHTRVRAPRPLHVPDAARRPRGGVRLHRRVVQHPATAFRARLRVTPTLRAAASGSHRPRGPSGSCRSSSRPRYQGAALTEPYKCCSHTALRGSGFPPGGFPPLPAGSRPRPIPDPA